MSDDSPYLVESGGALLVIALTAMVLVALTAFWAIGSQAYLLWEIHDPWIGTNMPEQTAPTI